MNNFLGVKDLNERLRRFRNLLVSNGVDAAIITGWENLYYFVGVSTMYSRNRVSNPMPLIVPTALEEIIFIPTKMFSTAIGLENSIITGIRPFYEPHPWRVVATTIKELGLESSRIGVEFKNLTVYHYDILKKLLPSAQFVDCSTIINELRAIKTSREIEFIRRSCEITDRVLKIIVEDFLRPGKTELQLTRCIIKQILENGGEGASFFPQVLSGYRSALLNVTSSNKTIEKGDIVMLDFGTNYMGYCSDTARPVVIGKSLTEEQKKACDAALEITVEALNALSAGVRSSDVHLAALRKASELGYLAHLRHPSGHGIGLDVWEIPSLSEFDNTFLQNGMTLAVEQGVYLRHYGFRFEQNVIVTEKGYVPLFKSAIELLHV